MKYIIVILFLTSIITSESHVIKEIQILEHSNSSNKISLCGVCNNFISNGIKQLINVTLQSGVIGGCSVLCKKAFLNHKTEENKCNMLCDAVGVYTFINLIHRFSGDLDPIYFCELAHVCPIHDNGLAHLDKLIITPKSGFLGTNFEVDVIFTVINQTSTGEIVILVKPPKSNSFEDSVLDTSFIPGQYSIKFSIVTNLSEEEAFENGIYNVEIFGCDGKCGSRLPHSAILFTGYSNFTIIS